MIRRTQLILIGIIVWGVWTTTWAVAEAQPPVSQAQENLKKLGYYKAEVDGIIGPKTQNAIFQYQYAMKLPITGVLDEATIDYLRRPTIIFNTQDFAPFHYKSVQGDEIYGPVPQIVKLVCHKAGINYRIKLYEKWSLAQEDVKAGKADGLFVIAWNSKREQWLHRSEAIIKTEYGLFVNDEDLLRFENATQNPTMLDGYTIGVYGPSGTSNSLNKFKTAMEGRGGGFFIDMQSDDKPLFKKLSTSKEKYAVYSNRLVGETIIAGMKLNKARYAGKHKTLSYYIGFSKKRVPLAIVQKFNKVYATLEKDGTIASVMANNAMSLKPRLQQSKPVSGPSVSAETPEAQEESINQLNKITSGGASIVLDPQNCLMWQHSGSKIHVDWDDAVAYIEKLNVEIHAGYSDWRLPNIAELSSLIEIDLQRENRMYIDSVFDSLQQACWSSDKSDRGIQFVDYYDGETGTKDSKDTNFVRAVRDQSDSECRRPN